MDLLQESKDPHRKTFINHVFSTSDESKAEFLNGFQYAVLGVLPVVMLNKLVQRFVPDASTDKSSLEITIEVLIQILVMIGGVIVVHRVVTFVPTYSGFKYDSFAVTNAILLFFVVVLSIQTKIGMKIGILADRVDELWNGEPSGGDKRKGAVKRRARYGGEITSSGAHVQSQADHIDSGAGGGFPPMPMVQSRGAQQAQHADDYGASQGPMPANAVLGSAFNSF